MEFQLTAPLREPTSLYNDVLRFFSVSTHGSLAGADGYFQDSFVFDGYVSTHGSLAGADKGKNLSSSYKPCFNSRLPCGSRQGLYIATVQIIGFNSRLPCGSRPDSKVDALTATVFQLTAPLREPTCVLYDLHSSRRFQLTAPLREPTVSVNDLYSDIVVSTHGSLAGADHGY